MKTLLKMVLDLPGGLFGQDDVRETATITTGTQYWSIPGLAFIGNHPDIDDVSYGNVAVTITTGPVAFQAPVNLPQGAVVTAVVVFGSDTSDTWVLRRAASDSAIAGTMANSTLDTEDTSISDATIDNQNFVYALTVGSVASAGLIHGARITYTI